MPTDAPLGDMLAALLRYKRMRQAAYLYVHRTLAKEVAITKEQVAGRMRQRFPDCPESEIELAVNDVFQAFIAKKAASVRWGKKKD
jgi:phage terminase Nu1 subunit (DNA packaging protein)